MNIQKIRAAAGALGLGLLAVSVSVPAALAGPKGFNCPFTAKDIDGWYKEVGFDGGSAEVGDRRNSAQCVTGVVRETGATAPGIKTNKRFFIDVSYASTDQYEFDLTVNGVPYLPATMIPLAGSLTEPGALADCITAVTTSQAFTRWACPRVKK